MPLSPGEILHNGRYRIVKLLGKGGFGEVYQAWDQTLEGACAVKRNLQLSAEVHRQFEKEARLLFKLQHAGLPMVYDYFEELGEQYLVMQFIEGENLQSMINRRGAIPVQQALAWIEQVCAALIYLHSRQPPVIHRDIKPANIIITPEGRAVLVDFGIAKTGDVQQMTSTGARGVTPGFSPPEQYGQAGTDAQSDVYALAATLYALLTGKTPDDALLITLKERPPVPPAYTVNPKIPRKISATIQAAMQLSRTKRTRSVSQFVAALKGQAVGEGVAAPPPVGPTIKQKPSPEGTQPSPKEVTPSKTAWTRVVGFVLLGIFTLAVIAGAIWWISQASNRNVKEINLLYQTQTAAAAWLERTVQAGRQAMADQETASAETREAFDALQEATQDAAAWQATVDALATEMEMANERRRMTEVVLQEQATQVALQKQATLKAQAREETQRAAATDTPTVDPSIPPVCNTIGQTWTSPKDGMNLVCVPAGEFSMGSENGEDDEKPVHIVRLDAFWIDQTEVTNAMFTRFVQETGYQTQAEKAGWAWAYTDSGWKRVSGADWRHPQGPSSSIDGLGQHPVVQVSWDDALAYCQWAERRLPTEAEWEKAARGTDGRTYPWGDAEPAGDLLNFADVNLQVDWADNTTNDGYQLTAPVGSYPAGASPYGALDMAGNVWEWVTDWYAEDYYDRQTDWYNPLGPGTGELRVLRGGSWNVSMRSVRASDRDLDYPYVRDGNDGFRCSRSP